jgi:hypothetical protein
MSFADFWEQEILDHVFDIGSYTAPSIYVGLSTANPGEDASGLAEPSGNGYARVEVTAWSRATSTVDNDSAVTFPEASGSWGTITHFALFDAATSGNMLAYAALDSSRVVTSGITPRFAAGELDITLG